MGTCVHGMTGTSLHVCARNDFSSMSETLVFVDPNVLDVCARKGSFFLKNHCVLLQNDNFFDCASLIFCWEDVWRACVRGHFPAQIQPPKFNPFPARVGTGLGTGWHGMKTCSGGQWPIWGPQSFIFLHFEQLRPSDE